MSNIPATTFRWRWLLRIGRPQRGHAEASELIGPPQSGQVIKAIGRKILQQIGEGN